MVTEFDSKEEDEIRHYVQEQAGDGIASLQPEANGSTAYDVYRVHPDVDDIGQAIQEIHDNLASTRDVIEVPPGDYHNQNTTVTISKNITLRGQGGALAPKVVIWKQSDIVSLEVAAKDAEVTGIHWSGSDVADTSLGIHMTQGATVKCRSDHHGSHAMFVEQVSGSNLNNGEAIVRVANSDGDGVRFENTSGDVTDINGGYYRILETFSNAGSGVHIIDSVSTTFDIIKSNQNGAYGVDHSPNAVENVVRIGRTENNTSGGLNAGGDRSSFICGNLKEGLPDTPNFPSANILMGTSSGKHFFRPPAVNDSNRPVSSSEGTIVYNTTDGQLNIWNGADWTLPDGTVT